MVRRYSHKAIVTIQSGQLVKGEWVAGEPTEIEVTGQYFPSNSGQQLKRNVDGKEFIVHGEFSTKARPVSDSLCNLCVAYGKERWFDSDVER